MPVRIVLFEMIFISSKFNATVKYCFLFEIHCDVGCNPTMDLTKDFYEVFQ